MPYGQNASNNKLGAGKLQKTWDYTRSVARGYQVFHSKQNLVLVVEVEIVNLQHLQSSFTKWVCFDVNDLQQEPEAPQDDHN